MVRRKKNAEQKQGRWKPDSMGKAFDAVRSNSMTIRKAARTFGVPKSTLQRRLSGKVASNSPASRPPVFSVEQEAQLVGHILDMEARGFGLTVQDICKLAFQSAEHLQINHSFNIEKRKAGYDWYQGFMVRHPQLSLRKPEGLSALRANMLNRNVVSGYFTLLGDTLEKLNVVDKGAQIYNIDETGMNTVHQPSKVIGEKGKKSIHVKTSGDRGENITAVVCMSATGHFIPPMIIFKGQRLNKGLVSNAPEGTLFATSKSSFIDTELFHDWFANQFIKHLPPARPVLLVLDGHASHISLSTLLVAKQHNVEMICLPPHTTSELQPLDKCLFKPLKNEYNKSCTQFLKENPGQVITRYEFCGLFKKAYYKVCSPSNAMSAFRATGIVPLNPEILPASVYAPSTTSVLQDVREASSDGALLPENKPSDQPLSTSPGPIPSTSPGHIPSTSSGHSPSTSSGPIPPTSSEPIRSTSRLPPPENETPISRNKSETRTLTDILNVPTVVKSVDDISNKKSRRVTSARCITEVNFLEQLAEKERAQEQKRMDKENRQKDRATRKIEKQQIDSARIVRKANSSKGKGAKSMNGPENYCTYCNGYYFDDESDDEDWVKCRFEGCKHWYHESCTGLIGRNISLFMCTQHST